MLKLSESSELWLLVMVEMFERIKDDGWMILKIQADHSVNAQESLWNSLNKYIVVKALCLF